VDASSATSPRKGGSRGVPLKPGIASARVALARNSQTTATCGRADTARTEIGPTHETDRESTTAVREGRLDREKG